MIEQPEIAGTFFDDTIKQRSDILLTRNNGIFIV
jgi:hypothetical protein